MTAVFLLGAVIHGGALVGSPAAAGEQDVGARVHLRPSDMPAPHASPSPANPARRVALPALLPWRVPPSFRVNAFAVNVAHARWMAVAANGDVLLAEPRPGRILLLRDADEDGRAEHVAPFATGLPRVHGLAIHGDHLYASDPTRVWRLAYRPGQLRAAGAPEPVTAPGALGRGGGHSTRNLAFSPDGSHFFVAVGSVGNVAEEAPPRATVQRFRADGSGQATYAAGLRNAVGIVFRPGTNDLYVVVNERDGLGDGLEPDYLARLESGAFYGWPYGYIGRNPDPVYGARRPDLVARTRLPEVLFRSHSAPLGLVFYNVDQFPAAYRGDAFVALHGSWNAAKPTGYKIVRVPFKDGRPLGSYETFASGFWLRGRETAQVWGRPAGLAVAGDGSLLVADDVAQAIWRISYRP